MIEPGMDAADQHENDRWREIDAAASVTTMRKRTVLTELAAGDLSRFERACLTVAGIAIALALAGAVMMALVLRANTISRAEHDLDQIGAIMADQIDMKLHSIELVLRSVSRRIGIVGRARNTAGFLTSLQVELMLGEGAHEADTLDALWIVDLEGRLLNSTQSVPDFGVSLKERPFFRAVVDGSTSEIRLSRPIPARANGEWLVMMAERLVAGPANLDAVIMGGFRLAALERMLAVLAPKAGNRIALVRSDGAVIASSPRDPALNGQTSPLDGKPRILVRRPLETPGLFIELDQREATILTIWRREASAIAAASVAAIVCVFLVLVTVLRNSVLQRRSRVVLHERNHALRTAQHQLERQADTLRKSSDALVQSKALLTERSAALTMTLQHIDQGILMVDPNGNVAVYNQQLVEMMGLPENLLATRPPFTALLEYQWERAEFSRTSQSLQEFVRAGGQTDQPLTYQRERPNGQTIEVNSQPMPGGGMVRTFTDITDRKRSEALIERAALVDELTELPSRLALVRAMAKRLANPPEARRVALLYLSLDRFRLLNDARGHDFGDLILRAVARRLCEIIGPDNMVARGGGDEFAVVASVPGDAQAVEMANDLLHRLAEPHMITGIKVAVTVSIGVALAEAGSTAESLLRNADIALNRAQDGGRNQISLYIPTMAAAREERFQLEQALREAIGTAAFRLAYQPIVSVQTGKVVGFEALLRWTDRVRGDISPAVFIPMAEATGLIVPLGRSVLEWACFEAASWPNDRTIAVNLSPAQIHGDDVVEAVQDVLRRSGLPPGRLELEVTEGMLLDNTGPVLETIIALQNLGVSVTLDDFGTGHAGLSYLRRFPFTKIKIDGSFVRNLGQDRESDAIVEAMLLLGQRLQLRVVAEGVETEAQLEQLRALNCPLVQGYLTGRPMPPKDARALP